MDKGKAIIDGDIIAYRAAFSSQELGSSDAERKVDDLMSYILDEVVGYFAGPEDYVVYITGKTNFRFEVAKSHPTREIGKTLRSLDTCLMCVIT